jgi:hypothetical protein
LLDLACCQLRESPFNRWQQRAEVIDVVARRDHHDDADTEARKILLVLDALIDGQQRVELPVGELESAPFLIPAQPSS